MVGAYQFLKKYGVMIGFSVGAVISALTYMIIIGGYPDTEPTKQELYQLDIFDFGIVSAEWLVYTGVLLILIFFVKQVIEDPKGSVKPLVGFVVIIALYFITQAMGDGTLTLDMVNGDDTLLAPGEIFEEGVSQSEDVKFSDGFIKFGYVMLGGAIMSWILGAIYGIIKQR